MSRQQILHIRFSEELLNLIKAEAGDQDIAVAQFIRESATRTALTGQVRRGKIPDHDPELVDLVDQVASRLGIVEMDEDFKEASRRNARGSQTRAQKAAADDGANGNGPS